MSQPVDSASSDKQTWALMSTFDKGNGWLSKMMAAGFAASSAYASVKRLNAKVKARREYTISVLDEDTIYPEVHRWLIKNTPRPRQRAILVESDDTVKSRTRGVLASAETPDEAARTVGLRFLFDGKLQQSVVIDGHTVQVVVEEFRKSLHRDVLRIVFKCPGIEARDAVLSLLSDLSHERQSGRRDPRLYIATKWGEWSRRDDLTPRALDSVVLAKGVKESLVDDFTDFRRHEADFIRMGVPYHRGYLFYGPPGSGKTSIAKAIASHFGMDVYYMPLSDLEADANLITMVSRVPAGSMLLLEDIDVAHLARSRDDSKQESATLSGILNAIDGVATPHGLIVVMTTNKREVLDEALIRPGRVDCEMEIGYATEDQIRDIFQTFTGIDTVWDVRKDVTTATVVGEILKNIDRPNDAVCAVEALIR